MTRFHCRIMDKPSDGKKEMTEFVCLSVCVRVKKRGGGGKGVFVGVREKGVPLTRLRECVCVCGGGGGKREGGRVEEREVRELGG